MEKDKKKHCSKKKEKKNVRKRGYENKGRRIKRLRKFRVFLCRYSCDRRPSGSSGSHVSSTKRLCTLSTRGTWLRWAWLSGRSACTWSGPRLRTCTVRTCTRSPIRVKAPGAASVSADSRLERGITSEHGNVRK